MDTSARYQTKTLAENGAFKKVGFPGRLPYPRVSFAQFERDVISERTKAGLKAARARGARGGRKPKLNAKNIEQAQTLLQDQRNTMDDVAKLLKVSRSTLYRALQNAEKAEWARRSKAFKGDPLARRKTLELVRAYYRIADPKVRKLIFELTKTLGDGSD